MQDKKEQLDEKSLEMQIKLDGFAKDVLRKKEWTAFDDIAVKVIDQPYAYFAYIPFKDRQLNLGFPKQLYEAVDVMKRKERLSKSRDEILYALIEMLVTHEHGHHILCPRDVEMFQELLKGSFEVISKKETRFEKIKRKCLYIQNLFSDTIIDTVNSNIGESKDAYREGEGLGSLLHYTYERNFGKSKGILSAFAKTDKAHALFGETKGILCNINPDYTKKIRKVYPIFPKLKDYTKKVIDIFTGDEELTDAVINKKMTEENVYELTERMKDRSLWKDMCKEYTKIIYPLLSLMQKNRNNSFTREKGQGEQQAPDTQEEPQKKKPKQKKNKKAKNGDKKKNNPKGKEEGKKDNKEKDKCRGGGTEEFFNELLRDEEGHDPYSSEYLKDFYTLDNLYKQRAGKIRLFAQEEERESPEYEIKSPLEEMSFEEFRARNVEWSATRIFTKNGKKNIQLYKREREIEARIEDIMNAGGLPDLSWIYDSSFSMEFEPYGGYGEYHLAVLTFYSMLKYLETESLARMINYNLINFSDITLGSDWQRYEDIKKVKRILFDHQNGGTYLAPEALKSLREQRKDNFITFMLTDCGFNFKRNMDELLKEVDDMQSTGGIGLFLYNLGAPNYFSKEMENRGVFVRYINDVNDFMNDCLMFTKKLYGAVAK